MFWRLVLPFLGRALRDFALLLEFVNFAALRLGLERHWILTFYKFRQIPEALAYRRVLGRSHAFFARGSPDLFGLLRLEISASGLDTLSCGSCGFKLP